MIHRWAMRRPTVLLSLVLWAALLGACQAPSEPPFYLGGIQVNEPDLNHWLDTLQAAGMNTVSVTDYAKHGDWDSANLWWDENPGIVHEIRGAEARQMQTVLILRVALDHAFVRNRFLWHGMILPKSDAEIDEWFARYTRFALSWAEVAEREGVDLLVVGSEMNALTSTVPLRELPPLERYYLDAAKQAERREALLAQRDLIETKHLWLPGRESFTDLESYVDSRLATEAAWAAQVTYDNPSPELEAPVELQAVNARRWLLEQRWRELIARIREVYHGKLGYAANFDQYHLVTFWDDLDVLGINAYFSLRLRLLPPEESDQLFTLLKEGWRKVLLQIEAVRVGRGVPDMPVVFTEMGYTYRANSTIEPWADTGFSVVPTRAPPPPAEDGSPPPDAERGEQLIVWREQPVDLTERALAVLALHEVLRERQSDVLRGILYWKLSTLPSHRDIESFLLVLGGPIEDPLLAELRRFLPAN